MAEQTVRIEGLEGVLEQLQALPAEIVSKAGGPIKFGLRAAARLLQEEMRANVDRIVAEENKDGRPTASTGALRESIQVKRIKVQRGQKGERMLVGVLKLSKRYAKTRANARAQRAGKAYEVLPATYYAWFLEFGTERQDAKPFVRPAYDAKKQEALSVFSVEVRRRIELAIKRAERLARGKR